MTTDPRKNPNVEGEGESPDLVSATNLAEIGEIKCPLEDAEPASLEGVAGVGECPLEDAEPASLEGVAGVGECPLEDAEPVADSAFLEDVADETASGG